MGKFIPDGAGAPGIEEDFVLLSDTTLAADDIIPGWSYTAIGNGITLTALDAAPQGVLRSTTDNTAAGDGGALHGNTDQWGFNGKEGGFGFRFRYPDITGNVLAHNNFRIGIDDSVTSTDPAVGLFVKSVSGVLEVQAESTNGDVTVAFADVPTLTSGTTAVKGTWHNVDVRWWGVNASSGPSDVEVRVDGWEAARYGQVLIGSAEKSEFKIVHWNADATTGDHVELDIDYVYFWQAR